MPPNKKLVAVSGETPKWTFYRVRGIDLWRQEGGKMGGAPADSHISSPRGRLPSLSHHWELSSALSLALPTT